MTILSKPLIGHFRRCAHRTPHPDRLVFGNTHAVFVCPGFRCHPDRLVFGNIYAVFAFPGFRCHPDRLVKRRVVGYRSFTPGGRLSTTRVWHKLRSPSPLYNLFQVGWSVIDLPGYGRCYVHHGVCTVCFRSVGGLSTTRECCTTCPALFFTLCSISLWIVESK